MKPKEYHYPDGQTRPPRMFVLKPLLTDTVLSHSFLPKSFSRQNFVCKRCSFWWRKASRAPGALRSSHCGGWGPQGGPEEALRTFDMNTHRVVRTGCESARFGFLNISLFLYFFPSELQVLEAAQLAATSPDGLWATGDRRSPMKTLPWQCVRSPLGSSLTGQNGDQWSVTPD